MNKKEGDFVKWFSDLSRRDFAMAGFKAMNLAEMYNNKFPVPPGFVITTEAYRYFLEKNNLKEKLMQTLRSFDFDDKEAFKNNVSKIKSLIEEADMPKDLEEEILEAYEVLDVDKEKLKEASESALDILRASHEPPFVAVRSSAITKEFEDEDFQGKHDNFLNIKGEQNLIETVKKSFASLFSADSLSYRREKEFSDEETYIAVIVQKMIDSDKSGLMFSKNPIKNDGSIVIKAIFGLGEGMISENIEPDNYFLDQELNQIDSKISNKRIAVARNSSGKREVIRLDTDISRREVLTGHERKMLSQLAKRLEEYYGEPQEVEFAISKKGIFIVQSRPVVFSIGEAEEEPEEKVEETPKETRENAKEELKKPEELEEVQDINEEELILKALGEEETKDDYHPSLEKDVKKDFPELNEAIPVDSEQFKPEEEEKIVDLDENEKEIVEPEPGEEEELEDEITEPELTSEKEQLDEITEPESEEELKDIDEMLSDEEIPHNDESNLESLPVEETESEKTGKYEEVAGKLFENQEEEVFGEEVEKEVEESEARSNLIKEVLGKEEEPEEEKKEKALDIF